MRRKMLFICLLLLHLNLSACVSYPEKHTFVLKIERMPKSGSAMTEKPLTVSRFRTAAPYESKNFVYRKGDVDYESDYYNAFLSLPGDMMTDLVREWLGQSQLFKFVLDAEAVDGPHFNLQGYVKSLYGDYTQSGAPVAVLEIRFSLSRKEKDIEVVLFQKEYKEQVPAPGNSPEHLVRGWNDALVKALTAFETDLIRSADKWQ